MILLCESQKVSEERVIIYTWTTFTPVQHCFVRLKELAFILVELYVQSMWCTTCDKKKRKMKKGEMISVRKRYLLFVKWKDNREVSLLTNIHDASIIVKKRRSKSGVGGYEETVKPTTIEQYNKYMSGVDGRDQFLSYYNFNCRTNKLWRKAFFCLLDIAIYNSFVLYSKSKLDHRKLSFLQFRTQLARELVMDSSSECSIPQSSSTQSGPVVTSPSARLVEIFS